MPDSFSVLGGSGSGREWQWQNPSSQFSLLRVTFFISLYFLVLPCFRFYSIIFSRNGRLNVFLSFCQQQTPLPPPRPLSSGAARGQQLGGIQKPFHLS